MAQEAKNSRREGTGKSGLALIGLAVVIIAVIAVAAWILMQPGVLENVLYAVAVIAAAIVVIVIVAYAVYALAAIPIYMMRGEEYQENVDYSMDDVRSVESKTDKDEDCKN